MTANTVDMKNPQTSVARHDHQHGSIKKKVRPFLKCPRDVISKNFNISEASKEKMSLNSERGQCQMSVFDKCSFSLFSSPSLLSHQKWKWDTISTIPGVSKLWPQNKISYAACFCGACELRIVYIF